MPKKRDHPKRTFTSSNHSFSEDMLVFQGSKNSIIIHCKNFSDCRCLIIPPQPFTKIRSAMSFSQVSKTTIGEGRWCCLVAGWLRQLHTPQIHPRRLTWNIIPWRFGRSCSFRNGWFVCSMLIFQGVWPGESPPWTFSTNLHLHLVRLAVECDWNKSEPQLVILLNRWFEGELPWW